MSNANAMLNERPDPSKVLLKALLSVRETYDIGYDDFGEILGLSGSQARRLTVEKGLRSKGSSERGVLFLRAIRSLETLVGEDVASGRAWLFSENKEFDGRCPIELLKDHEGLVDVVRYLDAMRGP